MKEPFIGRQPQDIILNGLIYIGREDFRAILEDEEVTDFDIIEVLPS